MSDSPVAVSSVAEVDTRAVASGIVKRGKTPMARVTLVFRPLAAGIVEDPNKPTKTLELKNWPTLMGEIFSAPENGEAHGRKVRLGVWAVRSVSDLAALQSNPPPADKFIDGELEWNPPSHTVSKRILRFWQKMMDPAEQGDTVWQDLNSVLIHACQSDGKTGLVLPTPHSEAGLVYTLERGRMVLDALAHQNAPLLARAPARPSVTLAGRPWLGPGEIQLADASASINDGRPDWFAGDEQSWLRPYREATEAVFAGLRPRPMWPAAEEIAQAALSAGKDLGPVIDRIHAAHHCSTRDGCDLPPCSAPEQARDTAQRRLGALLALPTLQRLVGFAADVLVSCDELPDSPFLLLTLQTDYRKTWTLARFQPTADRFVPASVRELDETGPQDSWAGMIHLNQPGHDQRRYDLCTVDPILAAEGDINRQANELARKNPSAATKVSTDTAQTLRSGGLRLIDRDALTAACKELGSSRAPLASQGAADQGTGNQGAGAQPVTHPTVATNPGCSESDHLADAERLAVGDRLLIGVRTRAGMAWRCPQLRVVRFEDPDARDDWIETELSRRGLSVGGWRRLQLDAGTLSQAFKVMSQDKDRNRASDPQLDAETKRADEARDVVAESTRAAWGGEPMGVPPIENKQSNTEWRVNVVEELNITRSFSAPIAGKHPTEALSPLLRFGWPYHVAVARVFDGGGSATLDDAGSLIAEWPQLALPAPQIGEATAIGRRFLRHERLDAPMCVFPDAHWQTLERAFDARACMQRPPLQRGADMVVRSSENPGLALGSTRRFLLPPPVPLHFAVLHDVVEPGARNVPQGLNGAHLLDRLDDVPGRLRYGTGGHTAARHAYYPDPAARLLAISLHRREDVGVGEVLEEAIVVEVSDGTWPNVRPVEIELVAAKSGTANERRLAVLGSGWLEPGDTVGHIPSRVPVQRVRIQLAPGEDVGIRAWFLPTAAQLSRWFDAVEAAALLAVVEGAPGSAADAGNACLRGLRQLLGNAPAVVPASNSESIPLCTGAAGLPVPPANTRLALAGLVEQALQRAPITALATPLVLRATHATDKAQLPSPQITSLGLARRRFPGGDSPATTKPDSPDTTKPGETRLDFLRVAGAVPWADTLNEPGATGALFGGSVTLDPAGTCAIELRVLCAVPLGDGLDPQTGRSPSSIIERHWPANVHPESDELFGFFVARDHTVSHRMQHVTAVRIDGIPLPADGRAGRRPFLLQALQSAAWGERHPLGTALRASLPAALTGTGARRLWVRLTAINRHAGLMGEESPEATGSDKSKDGHVNSPQESGGGRLQDPKKAGWLPLWLPATVRPAPPVVDHLHIAQKWRKPPIRHGAMGSFTVSVVRESTIRVYLRRPWYSSGEGEQLGLVLWPPGLFASGVERDDAHNAVPSAEFRDDDLGPGGPWVTRWGADPLDATDVDEGHRGPLIDPRFVESEIEPVPLAYMPVPIEGLPPAETASSTEGQKPVGAAGTPQPGTAVGAAQASPGGGTGQAGATLQSKPAPEPRVFLGVALQPYEPKFDPESELWYADVTLATDPMPMPRIRLGLVRYQPHAREDATPLDGEEPVRLRVSTPVGEWIQPLPGRRAEATCTMTADGQTRVQVTVSGPTGEPARSHAQKGVAMRVELVRWRDAHDEHPAVEEVAIEQDGRPASCDTWTAAAGSDAAGDGGHAGIVQRLPGGAGWLWTCLFNLPGPLTDDAWRHAVVIRETERREMASKAKPLWETGARFAARLELSPNHDEFR